ncbi:hypothetical protein [Paenibacillus hamazuiensis]|uniref:hypothetical protein n=1 Tax=Paenibacillus hamazuiensis TaxID=2936508 RepID=UPI00200C76C9|nr:hypothetical protein [Paenibacillus hamazuiensis]
MRLPYKMTRRLILAAVCVTAAGGCANPEPPPKMGILTVKKSQEMQELAFDNGNGRAVVIFEGPGVDCIVYASGLNPKEKYTISLWADDGSSPGVMWGPEENVKIRVGSLEGDTLFKPNSEGELYVSMLNPIRMFTGAKEKLHFEIKSEDKRFVTKSASFLLQK